MAFGGKIWYHKQKNHEICPKRTEGGGELRLAMSNADGGIVYKADEEEDGMMQSEENP